MCRMDGLPVYDDFFQQALFIQVDLPGDQIVVLQYQIIAPDYLGEVQTVYQALQFLVNDGFTGMFS